MPDNVAEGESSDARLLAAARAEVLEVGLRRARATSIATRAGVSRMTLYRRAGGVEQLVLDALTREFESVAAASPPADGSARQALASAAVEAIRAMASSPLVVALLEHDPELLIPYLVRRLGHSQEAVLVALRAYVAAGVADGSVRPVDPDLAALTLLTSLTGFVVSCGVLAGRVDPAALDAEVRHLIDAYLAPALLSRTEPS